MPSVSVEERFEELAAQFELLKSQVRQAQQLAGLGTAAVTIAHEVSNLLTPMLAYADTALRDDDHELMKKALTITAKNARMLVGMSERVLQLGAAVPPKRNRVNVRDVVEEALTSMCRDLSKDGIDVATDVDESMTVWADALQLRQVLFNLFLNAREAMAPAHSGRLMISVAPHGQTVVLTVRNTGPPIPEDVMPYIFDALQTTKTGDLNGRRRCGGLGLALCRDLIEENGGTISVASDQETGTTFTMTLPVHDGA